jgi:hypothetical protein
LFVPRVGFFCVGESVFSASVWTDGVPIVLPKTERVIVYRNRLAKVIRAAAAPTYAVVPWDEATRQFGFTRDVEPLDRHFVAGEKNRYPVRKWQLSLPSVEGLATVALDDIREIDEPT